MSIKTFTDETFEQEVLKSTLPVVVDFWAEWCGPCKMLTPIVTELATELDSKVIIGKMDVDKCPKTAAAYHINSIPSLLFIKNGKVENQNNGLLPKKPLLAKIQSTFGIA